MNVNEYAKNVKRGISMVVSGTQVHNAQAFGA